MAYVNPTPGAAGEQVVLKLDIAGGGFNADFITVPALQDVTINASNDVMTWSQLDNSAKLSVATTSTNTIDGNIVVDGAVFFGTMNSVDPTDTAVVQGILGLSRNKTKIDFTLRFQGSNGYTITGSGYITGLAPTVSADSPVWVSPFSITVTGEYLVQYC